MEEQEVDDIGVNITEIKSELSSKMPKLTLKTIAIQEKLAKEAKKKHQMIRRQWVMFHFKIRWAAILRENGRFVDERRALFEQQLHIIASSIFGKRTFIPAHEELKRQVFVPEDIKIIKFRPKMKPNPKRRSEIAASRFARKLCGDRNLFELNFSIKPRINPVITYDFIEIPPPNLIIAEGIAARVTKPIDAQPPTTIEETLDPLTGFSIVDLKYKHNSRPISYSEYIANLFKLKQNYGNGMTSVAGALAETIGCLNDVQYQDNYDDEGNIRTKEEMSMKRSSHKKKN